MLEASYDLVTTSVRGPCWSPAYSGCGYGQQRMSGPGPHGWLKDIFINRYGHSSLTNEKDHHYFLNRFVCVGEFFNG